MKNVWFYAMLLCFAVACGAESKKNEDKAESSKNESKTESSKNYLQEADVEYVTLDSRAEIVYDESSQRNIEWDITTEPIGAGLYKVTFDGTIKEGFHGYAMKDASAPIIEFENAEVVGDVFEPLEAEEHPEGWGYYSYCYYGKAIYVYNISVTNTPVKGYIGATICNEDNACTWNVADFTINSVETSTKPNIEWKVTSELIDVDNDLYQITFDGAIKEGCRVYSKITNTYGYEYYSGAPVIEFEGVGVIDIQEALAPKEYEDNGSITYYYDDRIVYICTIEADGYSADSAGYINGNIYSTSVDGNGNTLYDLANFKFKYITPQKQDGHAGRKYANFLHLPYQLQGHFDLDEAIEDATTQNKPIFVDVTGHACNNCREMETMVWGSDLVLPKLKDDFVICALYVDDNTKVEGGKRLGSINSKLVQEKWNVNAQPAYIILSPDGKRVLAGPRGYNTDIKAFAKFLDDAKAKMDSPTEYEEFTAADLWNDEVEDTTLDTCATVVYDESSSRNIEWEITTAQLSDDMYTVNFIGTFKEGWHGYAMSDFSAPYIEFENTEVVGDVYEPLTPVKHTDDFGTSYYYYDRAIYVYTIRVTDTPVRGYINATTCKDMTCTNNVAEFVINSI